MLWSAVEPLTDSQFPVEGGSITVEPLLTSTLRYNAPKWTEKSKLSFNEPNSLKNQNETKMKNTTLSSDTQNKIKILNETDSQLDANLRFQNSLAFPAIEKNPLLRNGGFLFFADGNDHEAYPQETLLVATSQDDDKTFSFMDGPSSAKILRQIRDKNVKSRKWKTKGSLATGCSSTVVHLGQ
jgi:hypothetical protein